ncbi:MAG: type II toxin-antitoxin system VapC family toxin [Actinomycetota bacterium]
MDSSALLAALIAEHEHHTLVRPHLRAAASLPAIVLAEAYAQLRRTFGQSAKTAASSLQPWTSKRQGILPTTAAAVAATFSRAVELDLGGNIHDALIAQVCKEHKVPLVTLDARQHRLALALGVESRNLLT